jgi:hypothetical protein
MPTLPTRRQARKVTQGRNANILVINDEPGEAAIVAIRQALIDYAPDSQCFFHAEDLFLASADEGHCAGQVVCRHIKPGAKRLSPPKRFDFDIYWERAKDEYGLPTITISRHALTEV